MVNTHFFGSSVGIAAGYKYVWLMLELTAGYTYCRPTVFGRERNIGGLTLYPAIGLQVKIRPAAQPEQSGASEVQSRLANGP